jgi:hypothetical protein
MDFTTMDNGIIAEERQLVERYIPSVFTFGFDKDGNIMNVERSGYIDVKVGVVERA